MSKKRRREVNNRRQVFLNFSSKIDQELKNAYLERYEQGLDNQSSVAEKIGVHRSTISKRLNSEQNLTIESIADLAWALGRSIRFELFNPYVEPTNQRVVISEHTEQAKAPKDVWVTSGEQKTGEPGWFKTVNSSNKKSNIVSVKENVE